MSQVILDNRQEQYVSHVLRRLRPIVLLPIILFVLVSLIGSTTSTVSFFQTSHQNILSFVTNTLEAEFDHIITELSKTAALPALRQGQPEAIITTLTDLLRRHDDSFLRARFITASGATLADVMSVDGVPRPIVPVPPDASAQFALELSLLATEADAFIAPIRLARGVSGEPIEPLRPVVPFFMPVFALDSNRTVGAILLDADATPFIILLQRAVADDVARLANRHLLLVTDTGIVLADSGAPNDLYLADMENPSGNINSAPLYQTARQFSDEQGQTAQFVLYGDRIFSQRVINVSDNNSWRLILADNTVSLGLEIFRNIAVVVILAIFASAGVLYFARRVLLVTFKPVANAAVMMAELTGEKSKPSGDDDLSHSIENVAKQLRDLQLRLQRESFRRTRDLQVAARIGREIATLYDIDKLLVRAINLICNELGFYHAQVFLLDNAGLNAILVHSRGEAGEKLLAQRHQIPIGSRTVVGRVGQIGQPVIVNDTNRADAPHGFNPILPETRAEMGLPLIVGTKIIGVLDIQSKIPNDFAQDDLPTYQLIADQLAIAIEHARTVNQSEERYHQITQLNRQLTREAWDNLSETLQLEKSYQYNLLEVQETTEKPPSAGLATPIRIRGETIGTLGASLPEGQAFTEGDQAMMQSVAERVALAVENQRLFMEAESERRNLDAIMATMPVGVIVLDPETLKPVQFNQRAIELLGRPLDPHKPFTSAEYNLYRTGTNLLYPTDDLPLAQAIRTGQQIFSDDVAVISEDQTLDVLLNAAPIRDARGHISRVIVTIQDISNLRSLENTLQENLRETVALYEAQRALSEAETLEDVKDIIIIQLALLQPTDGYLLIWDEDSAAYRCERQLYHSLDPRWLEAILSKKRGAHIEDVATSDLLPETARQHLGAIGVRSLILIPMQPRGRAMPFGWLVAAGESPSQFTPEQERTLTTIGDIATIAIDNRYLLERTEAALQETNALYTATSAISRAPDLDEVTAALRDTLAGIGADMVGAVIFSDTEGVLTLFSEGFVAADGTPIDLARLSGYRLPDERGLYIADFTAERLSSMERDLLDSGVIQAFAAINLQSKETPSGRLFVAYRAPHRFKEGEQRLLYAVAASASVVIDNNLLFEQIQSTLQETSVLYQASRALTQATNPSEIVDVIVNYLIEPHVTHVFMALLSTRSWHVPNATIEIAANWHVEDAINLQGVSLTAEQFPAWRQLATEELLIIPDVEEHSGLDPMERMSIASLDARSVVIIPLRVSQRPIGAIWIGANQPYRYTDRDERIFQAFSEQASLSLEAAYLLQQTEHRARQLETSAAVGRRAGEILDLNELLPQVVELIRQQFGYDHVQVFLMDEYDDYAVLRASTGEVGRKLLSIKHKLRKGSQSVIGRVTASGEPTIALDTADATVVHQPNPYLPLTRSELALPLIVKNRVVGALDVQSNQPNAFNEDDIRALKTLAAQISIAIDNARLYEEAQQRASDMAFLFDITTAATTADTVESALANIAHRLRESLEALSVAVYLPQLYLDHMNNTFLMMRPVAALATDIPVQDLSEIRVNAETVVGIVASTLQPQIVADVLRDIRYQTLNAKARSAIVTPITSGLQLVGLFVIESERGNAFNSDTMQLLMTLAGSLAAIIQNATLLEQLQKTNEQLREIDRLKSEFLANMSHELRTPLNSIIGFSRVMLKGIDGPLTEMQEQDLTTIYNSGQHLLNLINDLLDQAKIAANKMELKLAYFDVKPMIESVKSIAVGLIKEKTLDLFVEIAPNLPQAYGDEFRTRQILLNLVNNAIKFTTEGSVSIRAYATQTEDDGRTFIRVDVIDTGIGIAEKDMPLLFEAFRQVDSSLTRTVGGTGLGLPIARSLAEMQGGALTVVSEVNVGSTFSVFIPIEPTQDAEKTPPQKEKTQPRPVEAPLDSSSTQVGLKPARPQAAMPKQRLVLLIEDNKDMVDQFRRIIQREGFDVQTADHAAYAEAMASNLRPTLIVMDVNFNDGKGWDVLAQLQSREDTSDIPVIVVTLSPEDERAQQLGAFRVVQRPFMPEDLVEAVLEAEAENRRDRILIIDDEAESRRLVAQALAAEGQYRLYSAADAAEGIALVARRQPDLILLDLHMPHKDGFAVLAELQSNPETAHIPIIVVTADTDLSPSERQQLGQVTVIQKSDIQPSADNILAKSVEKTLKQSNGSR